MKRQLTLYLILLISVSCIVRKKQAARDKFITFEHGGWDNINTMIKKVHEQHWTIHYSYGDNCPAEKRNNDAALTAAVSKALQTWLQPLRDYTQKPIVNDFRYQLNPDWNAADFGINFHCNIGASMGGIRNQSPGIELRKTTNVAQVGFMASLLHEMGHIFGLADTYTFDKGPSKGGLDSTIGTQPAALMALSTWHKDGRPRLGKDDKNGIVWLYKVTYEGLSVRDCFFTDYELEHVPIGCVPKHPLIFELKHGIAWRVTEMLKEDKNLDINAQDEDGMTALHYAVIRFMEEKNTPDDNKGLTKFEDVVKKLLAHKDIKPFLRNKDGHSPLRLARDNKLDHMASLLLAHPLTLPVNAKGKKATTWGEIKRGDN